MGPDELSLISQLRDALATPSHAWDLVSKLGSPLERNPGCSGEERELTLNLRSLIVDLIVAETDGLFVDTSQASATLTALERRIEKRIAGEGGMLQVPQAAGAHQSGADRCL
jgi:hypothetical protein